MKNRFFEMMLQMIPVMLGVYLGFLVSDWSDARKRKTQSELLIENIQSEIKRNKTQINTVLEYHIMLRDSSRYYFSKEIINDPPAFFRGTRTGELLGSAYDTGIQTGIINELPINIIQQLSRLYNAQESFNDYSTMVTTGFVNKKFPNSQEDLKDISRFLAMTMTDIVIKEQELLKGYEVIEKKLAE